MSQTLASRRLVQLHHGIGLLYDSLLDADAMAPLLQAWSSSLGATGAACIRCNSRQEVLSIATHGYDPAAIRLWSEHYQLIDPTRRPALNAAVGSWVWDDSLLSPERSTQPEFVHDFGLRHGLRYLRGGKMHEDAAGSTVLTFHKAQASRSFDDGWVRQALSALQPHLARHARLASEISQLRFQLQLGVEALDTLRIGVLVLGKSGALHYLNHTAEQRIQASGGLRLSGERLSGASPAITDGLQKALRAAFAIPRQAGSFCALGAGGQHLVVRVVPMEERHALACGQREPLALVYFADPAWGLSAPQLQALFGLSSAEAQLAALLLGGLSPEDCARQRGTSLNTVRTQIRSLYAKSDTRSLSQFSGLARCLPALRPDGR